MLFCISSICFHLKCEYPSHGITLQKFFTDLLYYKKEWDSVLLNLILKDFKVCLPTQPIRRKTVTAKLQKACKQLCSKIALIITIIIIYNNNNDDNNNRAYDNFIGLFIIFLR